MVRTQIGALKQMIGKGVMIKGWIQTIRDQKKMQFLVVRDVTGMVQVVFEKNRDNNLADIISKLSSETTVTITGKTIENQVVKLGGIEIILDQLIIEGESEPQLPLDPFAENRPSIDVRMDWRFLDLRRPENLLMFKVQTKAEMAMREYCFSQDFIEIHSPKLMGSPSESGAELFEVPYFETKAYLAQSPQFYKQMAIAAGIERVLEIGPVFRADPSFTSRHMTEFTSVDVELAWIDTHDDVMIFMENWLQYIIKSVKETYDAEIKALFGHEIQLLQLPFPRISMTDAYSMLQTAGHVIPPDKKGDIDPAGERILGQIIKEKYKNSFFFLTDWPASARPFYHMLHSDSPNLTRSFDLIGHGLEICTGAQREHRFEVLTQQAISKGLKIKPIEFYLNFFKYGCPPHGGFGLGLSRLMMVLLGISNIRETVYLFRGPTRLQP